jgi:hypothetical protein
MGVRQARVVWWIARPLTYTGSRASPVSRHGGIAACTGAELGALWPEDLTIPATNGTLQTPWLRLGRYRVAGNRLWCTYPGGTARPKREDRAPTAADARAQRLIYLLEHHLLSATELHA